LSRTWIIREILSHHVEREAENEALKKYRDDVFVPDIDLAPVRRAKDREHQQKIAALKSDANEATQE
jgi:hypothetical protein